MGSKNKLKRFKENLTFDNVIQPTRDDLLSGNFKLKGKWNINDGLPLQDKVNIVSPKYSKTYFLI